MFRPRGKGLPLCTLCPMSSRDPDRALSLPPKELAQNSKIYRLVPSAGVWAGDQLPPTAKAVGLKCAARRPGARRVSDRCGPGYLGDPVLGRVERAFSVRWQLVG